MFMFWSKRAVLTRRLLKAKVRGEHETECETQEDTFSRINVSIANNVATTTTTRTTTTTTNVDYVCESEISTTRGQHRPVGSANRAISVANRFHQGCCGGDQSHDEEDEGRDRLHDNQQQQQQRNQPNRLTRCKELLKSLKENQLEMLLNAIESYGTDFGSCVLVPRKQMSPCRVVTIKSSRSPPASSGFANSLKTQQQDSTVQCNRHQRYGVATSLHENSGRRIPHRNILRSRRHHGGSRCSRCVSCHGSGDIERVANRDELNCLDDEDSMLEGRDNEMNLRVVDTTKSAGRSFAVEDRRHDQPAWTVGERGSSLIAGGTGSGLGQTGEDCGSRPDRDRCRRSCNKIGRSGATKITRKRRDSPPSSGGDPSSSESNLDSTLDDPHLLSCQIWRWPDLGNSSELKKLPVCHSAKDPVYVCCNPYHWSRLCKPESPPPPYCLIPDRLRPEDRAPSETRRDYHHCAITTSSPQLHSGSLTTNGEAWLMCLSATVAPPQSPTVAPPQRRMTRNLSSTKWRTVEFFIGDSEMGQKEWCTLAYWELGGRVGRLYPVEPATVNVFDSLHDGDGLCLSTLSENHVASPAVQRTRSKIGLGLMLSQESDGVWAYNRSDSPIFVNSPTLDDPESRTLLVYRVPPGFCLNIFDRAKTINLPTNNVQTSPTCASFNSGPVDVNSVRISFAKGWGPKYSRQEVTSCPCWLEVLLTPCR